MAYGSVQLVPGVNVERTPTLLRAGVSQSSLIRFRDSLVQKIGGWQKFYPFQISGVPRDMHAWQDLNSNTHLLVGTTLQLGVISSGNFIDITPTDFVSDTVPNISTVLNSTTVTITDPNITNVTTYDAVFFNVPISQGGIILDGLYQIASVTGTHSYTIEARTAATATTVNPTTTNGATASGNATLHFATVPAWVLDKMLIYDVTAPTVIPSDTRVVSTTSNTVVMTNTATGAGVGSSDNIVFSSIPVFTTTSGSGIVSVFFAAHGITDTSEKVVFQIPTTGNGVTIVGEYSVLSITDANNFTIQSAVAANASSSFAMNSGLAEIIYHIALGPLPAGVGYGLGLYGAGAYGFGTSSGSSQTGTKITAVDWTSDNWGELALACPQGFGIYVYAPTGGFLNASIVSTAPPFNSGIFVSMSQQILVAYGSSVQEAIGQSKQPLLVQWSSSGDYTNWEASAFTQAGNFTIPIGSEIVAGMAVSNQNLLWTDLDLWAMAYAGLPFVYSFNKIGAGMGAASSHSVQQLRGSVYWMGRTNFYGYMSGGANVLPCSVWDAVFQNLNTAYLQNIRAMPNTPYNEVGWLFPSLASTTGECDSYVKMNVTEPGAPWDYGPIQRSAWIDQTILGMPIGASPQGFIYQQETTNDADGAPLNSSFTTGEFYLGEGEDFVIVDQILPDFKWSTFTGTTSAQIQLTFNVTNYPGDAPTVFGPYTVTQATEYVSTRMRGRLMSITVSSSDLGSFWRLGSIKYRYAPAGRR